MIGAFDNNDDVIGDYQFRSAYQLPTSKLVKHINEFQNQTSYSLHTVNNP